MKENFYVGTASNRVFYCSECGQEFRIEKAIKIHMEHSHS